jgi:hypothetical protein
MMSREIDVRTVVPLPFTTIDFLFCWSGEKAKLGACRGGCGAVRWVKVARGSTMCFGCTGDETVLSCASSFSALKGE